MFPIENRFTNDPGKDTLFFSGIILFFKEIEDRAPVRNQNLGITHVQFMFNIGNSFQHTGFDA